MHNEVHNFELSECHSGIAAPSKLGIFKGTLTGRHRFPAGGTQLFDFLEDRGLPNSMAEKLEFHLDSIFIIFCAPRYTGFDVNNVYASKCMRGCSAYMSPIPRGGPLTLHLLLKLIQASRAGFRATTVQRIAVV